MALLEVENNLSMVVYCPHCSKPYEVVDAEGERMDYPPLCKRCGSPMDYEEAHQFGEAQAEEYASTPARRNAKN